jgi:hypothetical protein
MVFSSRRPRGFESTATLVLAALAFAGVLVLAAREVARSRRRSRRRALLAVPDDATESAWAPMGEPDTLHDRPLSTATGPTRVGGP